MEQPIALWSLGKAVIALHIKQAQRPVSTNKQGFFKASGKWDSDKIARMRTANIEIAAYREKLRKAAKEKA